MYRRQNLYPAVKNRRAISATIIESESNPGTEGVALSTCPGKVIDPPAHIGLAARILHWVLMSRIIHWYRSSRRRGATLRSVFRVPSAAMSEVSSASRHNAPPPAVSTFLLFVMLQLC